MLVVISIILQAFVILWTLYTKIRKGAIFEMIAVAVCGFALILNAFVAYFTSIDVNIPGVVQYIRFFLLSFMVPLAYMYFTRKIGRKWNNYILCMLWLLIVFILFPYIVIVLDSGSTNLGGLVLEPFKTYVILKGKTIVNAYTSDLIMTVQGLVTLAILLPLYSLVKKYGLVFTQKMRVFLTWWGFTVLYIVYTSFVTPENLDSAISYWLYFGAFFLIIVTIFTLVALDFDMNPLLTAIEHDDEAQDEMLYEEETSVPEDEEPGNMPAEEVGEADSSIAVTVGLDAFVSLCHEMAGRLRTLIYEEKVFINPEFKADDAIQYLGTNRTYFARMMSAEFGCKFSDLINDERLKYAHDLLETTEKSISDIAAESGFRDASYFSKKFSQKYGMSPKQFRSE